MNQPNQTVTVDLALRYKQLGFDPSSSTLGAVFKVILAEKVQALVTLSLVGECLAQAAKQADRPHRKRKAPAEASAGEGTQKALAANSNEKA